MESLLPVTTGSTSIVVLNTPGAPIFYLLWMQLKCSTVLELKHLETFNISGRQNSVGIFYKFSCLTYSTHYLFTDNYILLFRSAGRGR